MIDVRAIANATIQPINGDVSVTIRKNTGYTIGAGRRQYPTYNNITGMAQVQALDNKDLIKLEGLKLQGNIRALYLKGNLHGIIRAEQLGNDMVIYDSRVWLIAKVLETWPTWTKVVILEQVDNA